MQDVAIFENQNKCGYSLETGCCTTVKHWHYQIHRQPGLENKLLEPRVAIVSMKGVA